MKYILLLTLLVFASCAEPPKPVPPHKEREISLQYSQLEYRAAVVKWKVKEAEVQAEIDFGVINKTEVNLEITKHNLERAMELRKIKAVSETDYDLALNNYTIAKHDHGGAKLKYKQDLYTIEKMKALLQEATMFESK